MTVNKKYFLYRNIPVIPQKNVTREHDGGESPLKFVYAGLLGVAQGIFDICQNVDFNKLQVEFHIYGKGNELGQIENYIKNHTDTNIHYMGSFDALTIREKLRSYDFGIVPLRNRIYGAVPSKIFELTLLHLPMLFCGGGEGAEIVEEEGLGWTSKPGDFEGLRDNILKARELSRVEYDQMVEKCRILAREKYDFNAQMEELTKVLEELRAN